MRRPASSTSAWLLALAVLTSGAGHAQSTAASAPNARTRALRNIETSQASSLDAVPASIDLSIDRRLQTDAQEIFRDPSLTGLDTGEPDTRVTGLSTASDEVQMRSRATVPTATFWSHVPAAELTTQAEPASPDVPKQSAEQPILLPDQSIVAQAGGRASSNISASDQGTNSGRQSWLSRSRAQQQERAKRQARELEKKSDQQCSHLRSGEAECRLKLKKTHADASHGDLQTWR
jgi:hypothetical protein